MYQVTQIRLTFDGKFDKGIKKNILHVFSGYVGENCRGKCLYPYYIVDCHGQCDCDKERCDFSTGSSNLTKGFA